MSTGSPAIIEKVAKGRLALPRPCRHDVLSVARLLIPPLGYVDPIKWAVKELNLSSPPRFFYDHGFTGRCEEHNP